MQRILLVGCRRRIQFRAGVGDVVFRDCNKAAVVFVVGSTGMASDGDKQIIRVAASSQKETHERLVFAHVHSRGGGRGILHQVQVGQGGGHSRDPKSGAAGAGEKFAAAPLGAVNIKRFHCGKLEKNGRSLLHLVFRADGHEI